VNSKTRLFVTSLAWYVCTGASEVHPSVRLFVSLEVDVAAAGEGGVAGPHEDGGEVAGFDACELGSGCG
jgi:hypothetical protein